MKNTLFVCLLFMATNSFAQKQADLKLWYNKPAGNVWEDALPIDILIKLMIAINKINAAIHESVYNIFSTRLLLACR